MKFDSDKGNDDYYAEKVAEKEKKEKAIGLLTYLGQSVLDSRGEKSWYDVHPKHRHKNYVGSEM